MATARLFEVDGLWDVATRADPVVCRLADRHYSRRRSSIGCGQVGGPGRVLALRSVDHEAAWVSYYSRHPDDGLDAWRCSLFRNEGPRLSSELVLEAMLITEARWGERPANGWLTYVNTAKVTSANPGYCFKMAGWTLDRSYTPGRRNESLIRLVHP